MLDHFVKHRAAAQRLRANPIGSHLDGFTAWLSQRGFAWTTIRQHVWALAAFGRWLHRRGRSVRLLRRRDADDFCRRPCAVPRRVRDTAALGRFLAYLEAAHLIAVPAPVIDRSPLAQLKARYAAYLEHDRALSPGSFTRHWFVLRRFLVERFGDEPITLRDLQPDDVTRYVLRHVPTQSRCSAQVSTLRGFLRFLWQAGDIDRDLAAAIPPIRRWRLVEVPKSLQAAEVAHLLASVDRTSASGRRNYAILLLLARLGLRAGEVVRLELEDLDWRTGEVTVRGKGLVHARLVKALEHFGRVETPPGTAVYFDLHFAIALAVVDAPMVGVRPGPHGHESELIPWVRIPRHRGLEARSHEHSRNIYAIDIVHFDFLDQYIERHLLPFADEFSTRALKHSAELADGAGFVSGMGTNWYRDLEPRVVPKGSKEAVKRVARAAKMISRRLAGKKSKG